MQFADLQEFGYWIAKQGAAALCDPHPGTPKAVFAPSPKACEWCPLAAPGLCAARDEWVLADLLAIEDLDDLDAPPLPFEITPERRARLLQHSSTITGWLAALHQAAFDAAYGGNPDPGFKLVLGDEGDRKWGDEEKAEAILVKALGDEAYERKAKSPAQAEKVLKPGRKRPGDPIAWANLTDLITRSPARPVLVPSNDTRPEHRPVETMIAELDDLDDL